MNTKYKIIRVLNNNVILVLDKAENHESILVGKGLGFGLKPNKEIDIPDSKIEKSFITYDESVKQDYLQILNQIDDNVIACCTEIIHEAEKRFGTLNSRLHVVLTDHISFALERIQNGYEIKNPFLEEIKNLYEEEFQVGIIAQDIIYKNTNILIAEDEIGFIAMHLNAAKHDQAVKETIKRTRLTKEIVDFIEKELNCKIKNKFTYTRLVHHINGCIDRIENNKCIENPMLSEIKKNAKESFELGLQVKVLIEKSLNKEISDHEIGYMAMHIDRIKRNTSL